MKIRLVSAVVAGVLLVGLVSPIASAAEGDEWVQQIGTYDYLVSPNYAGLAPITSASKGTTLGLGTFNNLDGEFVMVGGTMYRIGTDGTPVVIDGSQSTPWSETVKFTPTASGPVPPGTTCANLLAGVNALAKSDEGMVAVRVRGTFSDLTFRSVPAQTVPYPSLSQVVASRPCSRSAKGVQSWWAFAPAQISREPVLRGFIFTDSPQIEKQEAMWSRAWLVMTFTYRCSAPRALKCRALRISS